ncbi:MAG: transposase [Gemmatimonadota bacterium]|nr:transposase [Gemmatimonadota bacterium]
MQTSPPPSPDFDGSGLAGFTYFVAFTGVFGTRRGDGKYDAAYDLNGDGGILDSDSGVMLFREVEAKIGILYRIVEAITDRRHQSYVDHATVDLVKQPVFQMACGYEDANDCNTLREDPGFKAACDRLPLSGAALASQPTMSRFENRISRTDLVWTRQISHSRSAFVSHITRKFLLPNQIAFSNDS